MDRPAAHSTPGPDEISAQLLDGIRSGDARAEQRLWARYSERVAFLLRLKTRDPHAAEDLGHEVFLAVREAVCEGRLTDASRIAPYIAGICSHKVAKWRESARRWVPLESVPEPIDGSDVEGELQAQQRTKRLRLAFARLSDDDQSLLLLRFAGDRSHAVIARQLKIHEAAVRQRVSRALARLRSVLRRGDESGGSRP